MLKKLLSKSTTLLFIAALTFSYANANASKIAKTTSSYNSCPGYDTENIAFYSFEASNEGWATPGKRSKRVAGNASHGKYNIRLEGRRFKGKDFNGVAISPKHNFSNYNDVTFKFDYAAKGDYTHPRSHIYLDASDNGGKTWNTLTSKSLKNKPKSGSITVKLSEKWTKNNVRFRFRVDIAHFNSFKHIDFDNIIISGKRIIRSIAKYSFEKNKQGWNLTKNKAKRIWSNHATDGTKAIRLKRNNGAMTSPRLDFSKHDNIKLDFSYVTKGRYTHKRTHLHLERQTNNGKWVKITGWNHRGTGGINRYDRSLKLCGDWLTSNVKLRIRVSLGHVRSNKFIDVDNIRITGTLKNVSNDDNFINSIADNTIAFSAEKITALEDANKTITLDQSKEINVNTNNNSLEVIAYPNPTTDYILLKNIDKTTRYYISNFNGQQLKQGHVNSNETINVSDLNNGIYILNYINSKGALKHIKFVKK